ncbi:unnamed protein product [Calypogeia fissa]
MASAPQIKNILLLDSEGKRVAVKYYSDDWPTMASKMTFEKSLFTKTQRISARAEGKVSVASSEWVEGDLLAEIGLFDGDIVVYKFISDLHFYVTGGDEENELILATVLQGFYDAVGILLRGSVEKKTVLENLDLVLLTLDEIVDGGIILECDANVIAGRVAMRGADADVPLSEQTISQALATAKEHLARNWAL